MDRNIGLAETIRVVDVALLAEGVDRNKSTKRTQTYEKVALLAEGVDRNYLQSTSYAKAAASPSSRRAWIEIFSKST